MEDIEFGQLIYLLLLLCAVGSWVFLQNRQSLNKTVQQLAVWGFIFLGVIAGYGLWGDIRQTLKPQQSVMAEAGRVVVPRAPDGRYYLSLMVNGAAVDFLVDTGASQVVLTANDARRAGIDPEKLAYLGRANTANGEVRTASVRVDELALGEIRDTNLRVWVNEGEMEKSLLGMTYLQRWSHIEIRNGALVLSR
ncbi:retropepsin-like aspartic protease family protein [Pseudophaeobacter leonis]|uniref:retropepsin-like aspartic protease family protein n=1 Tax=Pseudophaeobacter leonis TaxID=1144477 RepID=UPI0009F1F889|nr:TIGR02281 family clan AA aspartic protease [Pseudophaeobacter leonis]